MKEHFQPVAPPAKVCPSPLTSYPIELLLLHTVRNGYNASIPRNPRTAPMLAPMAAVGRDAAAPVNVAALALALAVRVGVCTAPEVLFAVGTTGEMEAAELTA